MTETFAELRERIAKTDPIGRDQGSDKDLGHMLDVARLAHERSVHTGWVYDFLRLYEYTIRSNTYAGKRIAELEKMLGDASSS